MTHTEAITYIEKHFSEYADQSIITDIIEAQMIPEDIPFKRFYHLYQDKHRAKYGEYLQIELKNDL
jgi:hypothetical protein